MPSTRKQLLARLHCIKRDMGWSDDEYRDILRLRAGVRSAADLPSGPLARLVAGLALAVPREWAPEWEWVNRAAPGRVPLLRKLIVLAGPKGLDIERGRQVKYLEGIARQMAGLNGGSGGSGGSGGGVAKPLAACDEAELRKIVQAVAVAVRRAAREVE